MHRITAPTRLTAALGLILAATAFQTGAAPWTHHGTLDQGGKPVNGEFDIRLTLVNQNTGGAVRAPLTFYRVPVIDNSFAIEVDFGIELAELPAMALRTEVSRDGAEFVPVGEPERVDAYAKLGTFWDTQGNLGTNPTSNFIGTVDAQAFVVRTANVRSLRIEPSAQTWGPFVPTAITANIIAGSRANTVDSGVRGATIAGGGVPTGSSDPDFGLEAPNRVTDHFGSVGGGFGNRAGDAAGTAVDGSFATVGGGMVNAAAGQYGTVSGGFGNEADGDSSVVGGGSGNTVSGLSGTIAGGSSNQVAGESSTIGGGWENTVNSFSSVVSGGHRNSAGGGLSVVAGGRDNRAAGDQSVIAGGFKNATVGLGSTVGGGRFNCAGGDGSWVGGTSAKTRPAMESLPDTGVDGCSSVVGTGTNGGDAGSFVWADSQAPEFISTGRDQFLVRADGGMHLNTNGPLAGSDDVSFKARPVTGDANADLRLISRGGKDTRFSVADATGTLGLTVTGLSAGSARLSVSGGAGGAATLSHGGTWTNASSRSYKFGFAAVEPGAILERVIALPISRWQYKHSAEGHHLGPMAEDFKAAFDLAGDGRSISTVDADGVALAAIQGLHQKLEDENAALRKVLLDLQARLASLEAQSK